MRAYELMYVVRPDVDEEGLAAVIERFTQLINNHQGEVESVNRWGKRRLAYEIRGYREGIYVLVHFKGEPATSRELDRVLKITDEVLRHLIVRRES